jgi:transcription initiation factor IIE alpha subunit
MPQKLCNFIQKCFNHAYFIISPCDINIVVKRLKTATLPIDQIDSEIIAYIATHGKANAGELAELVGITVPSIRYRIFQLMAKGIVGQEKARDHRVWWFLRADEKD